MEFTKYYRALARKSAKNLPHADEARRDFQDALTRSVDALLFTT